MAPDAVRASMTSNLKIKHVGHSGFLFESPLTSYFHIIHQYSV